MKLVDPDPVSGYEQNVERACKLLPAWFVERMMCDSWSFGLMLATGVTVAIVSIDAVHQAADGSLWIDATMQDHTGMLGYLNDPDRSMRGKFFIAPTSRTKISINAATIVAAFELADT